MVPFSQAFWSALAVTIVGGVVVVLIQRLVLDGPPDGTPEGAPDLVYKRSGVNSDTAVFCLNKNKKHIVADNDTDKFLTFYYHDVESMEPLFSLKPRARAVLSTDHIKRVIRYKNDNAPLRDGETYKFNTQDGSTSVRFYVNGDC
jgi:hypothetical protein